MLKYHEREYISENTSEHDCYQLGGFPYAFSFGSNFSMSDELECYFTATRPPETQFLTDPDDIKKLDDNFTHFNWKV